MKDSLGIIGYILLIIGAVFIDTPIIALLAIPAFITGMILLIIFYNNLLNKFYKLTLSGILLICGTLGYTAIEYNQYLVLLSRNEVSEFFSSWSIKILIITAINLMASYLVYLGLKKSKKVSNIKLLSLWLPTLILIPLTIFIIQIMYWNDYWLGG